MIEVADSGVGVPAEALRRAFEPFFTTKPVGRGTGLGLAICHRIITDLGGTIAIESNPGEGDVNTLRTFVRITLPSAEHDAQLATRSPHPRASAPRRILVIDDEPSVAAALETTLGAVHEVEVVSSGAAALARLGRDPSPDVVLCDVMMPGVDGIEVYERTRETSPSLAERFIFMSGGAYTPRARAFVARCSNPRIEKPFNSDQLLALIER